jgi:hypothetical protein
VSESGGGGLRKEVKEKAHFFGLFIKWDRVTACRVEDGLEFGGKPNL